MNTFNINTQRAKTEWNFTIIKKTVPFPYLKLLNFSAGAKSESKEGEPFSYGHFERKKLL